MVAVSKFSSLALNVFSCFIFCIAPYGPYFCSSSFSFASSRFSLSTSTSSRPFCLPYFLLSNVCIILHFVFMGSFLCFIRYVKCENFGFCWKRVLLYPLYYSTAPYLSIKSIKSNSNCKTLSPCGPLVSSFLTSFDDRLDTMRIDYSRYIKFSTWYRGLEDTNKGNWLTIFIRFICLCPLGLTIKLNLNISKVANS